MDDKRNDYIDEETILQVMDYAPDAEWRLIIALWRFSGLRAASEVLSLKWEDIVWDQKVIMVHAPKTERHAGKDIRKIPFFPHMETTLREAFEQAEEGSIYIVEKHAPLYLRGLKERTYISRQGNLGTVFKKIILRAGIVPWKKLIHNLRASFETDLLNGKHGNLGPHVIAYWLGHSVKVMLEHYGRIQKADYDKIAQACLEVEQRNKRASLKPDGLLSQNGGFNAENMESAASDRASLKASWYTAVGGVNERHGVESPLLSNSLQSLENTALDGKKRKREEPCGTASFREHSSRLVFSGWGGIQIGFDNPLAINGLGQSTKSSVTKSVTVCDEPVRTTKQ